MIKHPKKPATRKPQRPTAVVVRSRLGRKPVPEGETRRERFVRIGQKRMEAVIYQIRLLGNLCSPNYDCDAKDIEVMRNAILKEVELTMARFAPAKRTEGKPSFSFSDSDGHDKSQHH